MGTLVRKLRQELREVLDGSEKLEAEVEALRVARVDLNRAFDIDAEKAELARLQQERATILSDAEAERDRMLGQARADAEGIRGKARETAEQVAGGILARANADSETVRGEARSIVQAAQTEARRIVGVAQAQALQLMREAEAANATAVKALGDAGLVATQLAVRQKDVTEREQAVAKAEADLKRRVDATMASLQTIR